MFKSDSDLKASTVGLKTYFIYDERNPPERVTINQADLMLDEGVRLPSCGQTFLYGARSTQRLLGRVLMQAHEQGLDACIVEVRVNVGHWINRKQDYETLEELRFLKFPDRVKANLMDDMAHRWKELLAKHGLPEDNFPREPSRHMHLLDEIITQEPFNKANVIAFPLMTQYGVTQAALVVRPDDIMEVVPGTAYDTEVVLGTPGTPNESG